MKLERERFEDLLDGYLLGTLDDADRQWFEACLEGHEEAREQLESRRAALDTLSNLKDITAPPGLATSTIAHVAELTAPAESSMVQSFFRLAGFGLTIALPVLILAAILMPALARSHEAARRSSCQNNLKQMGLIFKMYSNESPGERFPPAVEIDRTWTLDLKTVYPEFMTDPAVTICPSAMNHDYLLEEVTKALTQSPPDWNRAHRAAAQSYTYFGWNIYSEAILDKFQRVRLAGKVIPGKDIEDPNNPAETIYAMREGIERFMITDINNPAASAAAQARLPVMFDRFTKGQFNHIPGGSNVVYMDGHVSFLRYGTEFPITPEVDKALTPK